MHKGTEKKGSSYLKLLRPTGRRNEKLFSDWGEGHACMHMCLGVSGGNSPESMFLLYVLPHFRKDPNFFTEEGKDPE